MSETAQSFPGAFCEPCNKWRKPDMLMPDGSCPKCGTALDANEDVADESVQAATDGDASAVEVEPYKVPWHFWVMVAATIFYLGWRVIQAIQSLF